MMTPTQKLWGRLARELSAKDARLARVIRVVGPPLIKLESAPFRALIESILSQQLAPKAARSIIDRVRRLHPPFPGPGRLALLSDRQLRNSGVSPQKLSYLRALSKRWDDTSWRRGWARCSDAELVDRLTEVKGIGEWTAHMFLIFSMGRPNVLPVGDYGVRRGLQLLFGLKEIPLPQHVPGLVPHWEGAYSVGSWYVWQSLDKSPPAS